MTYKVTAIYNWGTINIITKSKKEALDFWENKVSNSSSSISGEIEINNRILNPKETRTFTKNCLINNRMN